MPFGGGGGSLARYSKVQKRRRFKDIKYDEYVTKKCPKTGHKKCLKKCFKKKNPKKEDLTFL